MRRPPAWVWLLIAGAAILLIASGVIAFLLLTAGAQPPPAGPTPSASAKPSSPAPTESTSPPPASPEPTATTIPSCGILHPAAQEASDATVASQAPGTFSPPPGEIGRAEFDQRFGPVAQQTMDHAIETRGCLYVFSFHDGLSQFTTVIEPADRLPLEQALQADGDFVLGAIGPAEVYSWGEETEGFGIFYTVHAFLGDTWIATHTSMDPEAALTPTIEAMIAANPGLAG